MFQLTSKREYFKIELLRFCILFLACLFCTHTSIAQHFKIFDIETKEYPLIKAKYIYSEQGAGSYKNFSADELRIYENDNKSENVAINPPVQTQPLPLSVVLAFDVSSSMIGERLDIAKQAGLYLVKRINTRFSECAVSSFDHLNYLNCDFTGNKERLINSIKLLEPLGGTNYNSGFQMPFGGALQVAKEGDNKKVVIFLTDGKGEGNTEQIIKLANEHDITVYPVTIKMAMPEMLSTIASQTGGEFYENVNSVSEARQIYEEILLRSQIENYGEIIWKSPSACKKDIKVDFSLQDTNVTRVYELPDKMISSLQATPRFFVFDEDAPDTSQQILLKAIHADFVIEGITSDDADGYSVSPERNFPFKLKQGEKETLSVKRLKNEDSPVFTHFSIQNDQCPDLKIYLKSGHLNSGQTPIRVVSPNGGEVFSAGQEIPIEWEGIEERDSVHIYFSSSGGNDWQMVSHSAGLISRWVISGTTGNNNLIKVAQGNGLGNTLQLIPLNKLSGKDYAAHNAVFSSKSNFIITSEDDNSVKLWDAATGRFIQDYYMHTDWVYSVENSFDEEMLLSSSKDGTAKMFFLNSGRGVQILQTGTWGINKAIFTPDNKEIVTVGDDGIIRIWKKSTGELVNQMLSHNGWIMDVDISPDGELLVTANDDKTIRFWDMKSRKHIATLQGHNDWVYDVDFSPGGNYVLSSSKDGSFNLWNANKKTLVRKITTHEGKVYSANFSPDGKYIITSSRDGTVRLWETYNGELKEVIKAEGTRWYRSAEFDHIGNRVITTDSKGDVRIWLLKNKKPFQEDVSDEPFQIVSPAPSFEEVGFGATPVGVYRDTLLKNYLSVKGFYPGVVKEIDIVGPGKNDFQLIAGFLTGTMNPDTAYHLEIGFQPGSIGKREAQIAVETPTDTFYKDITGTGVSKNYEILANPIHFGKLPVHEYRDSIFSVLKNTGTLPLTLKNLKLSDPGLEHFELTGNTEDLLLKPGEEAEVGIRFNPRESGRLNTVLSFVISHSGNKEKVGVFAEATLPPNVTLKGRVFNKSDSLSLYSSVTCYDLDNDSVIKARETGRNGEFEFELKRGKNYRVAAEKNGFIPEGIHVGHTSFSNKRLINRNIYLSPVQEGSKVRLDNIFFEFAKAQLTSSSFSELDRVVKFMKNNPGIMIILEGHTDSIGNEEYNMELSHRRAKSVKTYLVDQGISKERIDTRGYGESSPITGNSTERGRELNRRVEFVITSENK